VKAAARAPERPTPIPPSSDHLPSSPRILVVAPTPFFGDRGCHVRIYEEIRSLARRGGHCEVVTYSAGNDLPDVTIHRAPRLPGVSPRALGPSYARPLLDLALAGTALRAARRLRPHVIHAHLHEGILIGAMVRRFCQAPLVADLQGSLTAELVDHGSIPASGIAPAAVRRLERWLVHQPDLLLVSSIAGVGLLETQGVDASRIESLPDTVDLDRFPRASPDPGLRSALGLDGKLVVVFLGVLTEYQGVDTLIAAVPDVIRAVPQAHFLIMGYPNEEQYRAKVRDRGLEHAITLPGRIPYAEAARHISLGAVAVSAKQSLTEANGKLLNYMACGLPVVATDTPVNRELLGESGVFAASGDPASLAAGIIGLLGDEPRRHALGSALRRRAERHFSGSTLGERLLTLYRRAADLSARHSYATQP
jgi:glycosyltransferase involved in cell wall biosynthesis